MEPRAHEIHEERPPPAAEPLRCAACGDLVGPGGAEPVPAVGFCAECVRRSHPEPDVELGVVD